jgi:ABC-2 type transport system ATP-binding protein
MTAEAAIAVRGISKRFGNHVAVENVSFTVPRGMVYGILGPNGAGKSTTLRMMNDIIAPDTGNIELLGKFKPGRQASSHIGYLPEERGLYPKMKVSQMIQFMGELRGLSVSEAKRRAGAWLEKLGLSQWASNKVQDLSKGMQQKVQFATALIHDPELVILDEPWSGLDPINAEVLRSTVDEIRAAGRTVLFSTHQMEQAEKICDAVCIIARGQLLLEGTLADIKRDQSGGRMVAIELNASQASERLLADTALVAKQGLARPGHGDEIVIELTEGRDAQQLLAAAIVAGVVVRRFEIVTPSLHQIFVERVGAANAAVAQRREQGAST